MGGVFLMFLEQLREIITKKINIIENKQAVTEQEIATEKAAFDKEWNKWTTPTKIKKKPADI